MEPTFPSLTAEDFKNLERHRKRKAIIAKFRGRRLLHPHRKQGGVSNWKLNAHDASPAFLPGLATNADGLRNAKRRRLCDKNTADKNTDHNILRYYAFDSDRQSRTELVTNLRRRAINDQVHGRVTRTMSSGSVREQLLTCVTSGNKRLAKKVLKRVLIIKDDTEYRNVLQHALHECVHLKNEVAGAQTAEVILKAYAKRHLGDLYIPQCRIMLRGEYVNSDLSILCQAVRHRRFKLAELLLKFGFDPNFVMVSKCSCLMVAAYKNDIPMMKLLLKSGARVEATMDNGVGSLAVACFKGNFEAVEELLDCGADVDSRTSEGTTPLMTAIQENHEDVVKFLVKRNANINAVKYNGSSPLIVAVRHKRAEFISFLGSLGADPNLTLVNGATALVLASANGDFKCIDALCNLKVDFKLKLTTGANALAYATHRGFKEILVRIIQFGGTAIGSRDIKQVEDIAKHKSHDSILRWIEVFKNKREIFDELAYAVSVDSVSKTFNLLQSYLKFSNFEWMVNISGVHTRNFIVRAMQPWVKSNSDVWPISFNSACDAILKPQGSCRIQLSEHILLHVLSFCNRDWFEPLQ